MEKDESADLDQAVPIDRVLNQFSELEEKYGYLTDKVSDDLLKIAIKKSWLTALSVFGILSVFGFFSIRSVIDGKISEEVETRLEDHIRGRTDEFDELRTHVVAQLATAEISTEKFKTRIRELEVEFDNVEEFTKKRSEEVQLLRHKTVVLKKAIEDSAEEHERIAGTDLSKIARTIKVLTELPAEPQKAISDLVKLREGQITSINVTITGRKNERLPDRYFATLESPLFEEYVPLILTAKGTTLDFVTKTFKMGADISFLDLKVSHDLPNRISLNWHSFGEYANSIQLTILLIKDISRKVVVSFPPNGPHVSSSDTRIFPQVNRIEEIPDLD